MYSDKLKVMIVDDSIVYRKILSKIVAEIDGLELGFMASNGSIALSKLSAEHYDVLFLDLNMPEIDGLEVIRIVREKYTHTNIIVISGAENAEQTIAALGCGAIDFIQKPAEGDIKQNYDSLMGKIKPLVSFLKTRKYTSIARKYTVPKQTETKPEKTSVPETPKKNQLKAVKFVCIGISTGGPKALERIIPMFPENFSVPVLIVQHMPPRFTATLAEHLNKKSSIYVKEVAHREEIKSGTVYIAPGGFHFTLKRETEHGIPKFYSCIEDGPLVNGCKPSVDILFESVKHYTSQDVISVIMTGMGADGCEGVRHLKSAGSYCITQNEESCVVYGMPKAVNDAGLSDEILDLEMIPGRIIQLVEKVGKR